MVAGGSADGTAWVWSVESYQSVYRLQGHKGMVCGVDIHPVEPIIASAGMDGAVVVTEVAKLE
jgi:Prp8 binding protein